MDPFKKILGLLTLKERKRAIFLLFLAFILSFFDLMGIASVMPFMTIILNPEIIETNKFLSKLFEYSKNFGVTNLNDFKILFGFCVFILLIFTLILRSIVSILQIRFTNLCEYRLAKDLLEKYLKQPYTLFLNQNSADFEKKVFSEIAQVIVYGINPIIILVTQIFLVFTIFTLLIFINPSVAVYTISVLSFFYIVIFLSLKKTISKSGIERAISDKKRFFAFSQTIGAIKEIKLRNTEETYIKRFAEAALGVVKKSVKVQVISDIPRYFIEGIAFGSMIILILVMVSNNLRSDQFIPLIALYGYAGYRLLPCLQQIYSAVTSLRFIDTPLENMCQALKDKKKYSGIEKKNNAEELDRVDLKKSLEVKNINFNYPFSEKKALKNINFKIKAFSKVAIVGVTGSGKTTIVDIILGLHNQQSGSILIDDVEISTSNKKQWQRSIGYVPQSTHLFDDSVAANIAFGDKSEDIKMKDVEYAAKLADIHDFITTDLKEGYNTKVGEKGARLSGGQKQSISIARALYHKPQLIVFDEATSALDNITEREVMHAIKNISKKATLVVITHKLSAIEYFDDILLFENGELKFQGDFDSLKSSSQQFKEMLRKNK